MEKRRGQETKSVKESTDNSKLPALLIAAGVALAALSLIKCEASNISINETPKSAPISFTPKIPVVTKQANIDIVKLLDSAVQAGLPSSLPGPLSGL